MARCAVLSDVGLAVVSSPVPAAHPSSPARHCCLVAQSCPTLCDPTDCSTPGFPVLHHLSEFAPTPTISAFISSFSSCPQSFPATRKDTTVRSPFSPKAPSHPGCHLTLSRVPCAIYTVGPWLNILNIAAYTCLFVLFLRHFCRSQVFYDIYIYFFFNVGKADFAKPSRILEAVKCTKKPHGWMNRDGCIEGQCASLVCGPASDTLSFPPCPLVRIPSPSPGIFACA